MMRSRFRQKVQQAVHDIRSPLMALHIAVRTMPGLSEEHRSVILLASARIGEITEDLLRNSQREGTLAAIDEIQNLVEDVIKEKRVLSPEIDIRLECDSFENEDRYQINAASFIRMISNLLDNCLNALKRKGDRIRVHLTVKNRHLICKISDNGPGIDPQSLPRLGERGFSLGNGMGLGLHHAKSQIESWNGSLNIESRIDGGTSVSLRLPPIN